MLKIYSFTVNLLPSSFLWKISAKDKRFLVLHKQANLKDPPGLTFTPEIAVCTTQ